MIDRFAKAEGATSNTKNETPPETIALQYRFLKRNYSASDRNFNADLVNIGKVSNLWELGNGLLFADLVSFVLTMDSIRTASVVIVLDLTRPEEMVTVLETLIERILTHVRDNLQGNNLNLNQHLDKQTKERLNYYRHFKEDNNNDESMPPNAGQSETTTTTTTAFPIPLTMVGTKYDEFQNMDPEKKKIIVRYLRTMAYYHGAQLVFVSAKSDTLTKRMNNVLEQLAFEPIFYESYDRSEVQHWSKPAVSTNFGKPIMIPFGYDTLDKIGVTGLDEARRSFDAIFTSLPLAEMLTFSSSATVDQDPRDDANFGEPELDKVLEYKYMLIDQNK